MKINEWESNMQKWISSREHGSLVGVEDVSLIINSLEIDVGAVISEQEEAVLARIPRGTASLIWAFENGKNGAALTQMLSLCDVGFPNVVQFRAGAGQNMVKAIGTVRLHVHERMFMTGNVGKNLRRMSQQ